MENRNISLIMLESTMMHMQQINKRMARITVLAICLALFMFGFFVYLFTAFEITTEDVAIDSGNGNASYIGNDGDIINGNDNSQEKDNQEEK